MKQRLASVFLLLAACSVVQAHFVFVVPEAGGANANVILSETLEPDRQVGVELIGGAKLSLRNIEGRETPLTLVKAEHAYLTPLSGGGTRLIHGLADLGIMQRGANKPHLLLYYPKTILGDAFDARVLVGEPALVEIVPLGKPGALTLQLLVRGKPQMNAEITVILPDGTTRKAITDETGNTKTLGQTGRYGAWARHWETESGERAGREYAQVRRYATLVFDAPAPSSGDSKAEPASRAGSDSSETWRFATLPQATASFGAVASDGWLYVYGGHVAATHSYSTEAVSGRFDRLRLTGDAAWELLPGGSAVQGMNLAAHGGRIYLIGGMRPHNEPGEDADNYSLADSARFDPETKTWEALPPLPEPRSSHDVVVVGDELIVTGGWTLAGRSKKWLSTLAVMNLGADKLEWKSIHQPFSRRALMAAAYGGKMYVIGGMNEQGAIVRHVSIYDPKSAIWSEGPELPDGPGLAFAPAAGVHKGRLYASVSDGTLFRLNESGWAWEKVGSATPRVAHRIASRGDTVLVIGGAAKGNNFDLIEAVRVGPDTTH